MLADPPHLLRIAARAQWSLAGFAPAADRAAWAALPAGERAAIGDLVAGFCVAEAAVAEHLAPFGAAAEDPDVAALLTIQGRDEARHAACFARLASELCAIPAPRARARPELLRLFEGELPAVAAALAAGTGSLAEGVALYHLVLEGLVFAIGQEALLARVATLPVARELVALVQRDERWHVGLGVRLLADLGAAVPPADTVVELALRAWGPADATPERIAHARRVHARRLREARTTPTRR